MLVDCNFLHSNDCFSTYQFFPSLELYFDMEMKQLEAIWADSSTQWNFDFNHRNEIQSNMNDAFGAQADQIFQLQDQQYKEMLAEALASVVHMEEVVNKYSGQVRKKERKKERKIERKKERKKDTYIFCYTDSQTQRQTEL